MPLRFMIMYNSNAYFYLLLTITNCVNSVVFLVGGEFQ